ncbi:MAG: exodeoxyribonuclease VII large subunit [candidate division Zixibacteria bacterium]|nr:exodeoxyribonuclease VII large subunit [candidate division Zixibacteria bacterium]
MPQKDWRRIMTAVNALTVSELTDRVKSLIEDTMPAVHVTGEISNYKHHSSGHRYFTLKDDQAQLRCVFFRWKAESLDFEPGDGANVVAAGKLTVYKPHGSYQLDVNRLFPAGVGVLEMAFRELKERLYKEGLFDEELKKALPEFPMKVGVITSPTGAAIQDFIRTLHNRAPWIDIVLRPAQVQGEGSAEDIAKAISEFNSYGEVDLLVLTRGGGSIEDLWAFNEEILARAIFASELPIISAVGHEIDVTIADFAADYRAATPTAAAEAISVEKEILTEEISRIKLALHDLLHRKLDAGKIRLQGLVTHHAFRKPLSILEQFSIKVDHLSEKLVSSLKENMKSNRVHIVNLAGRLNALSPQNVLNRGYSVCTTSDGEVVRDSGQLKLNDKLKLRFASGGAVAEVYDIAETERKG